MLSSRRAISSMRLRSPDNKTGPRSCIMPTASSPTRPNSRRTCYSATDGTLSAKSLRKSGSIAGPRTVSRSGTRYLARRANQVVKPIYTSVLIMLKNVLALAIWRGTSTAARADPSRSTAAGEITTAISAKTGMKNNHSKTPATLKATCTTVARTASTGLPKNRPSLPRYTGADIGAQCQGYARRETQQTLTGHGDGNTHSCGTGLHQSSEQSAGQNTQHRIFHGLEHFKKPFIGPQRLHRITHQTHAAEHQTHGHHARGDKTDH